MANSIDRPTCPRLLVSFRSLAEVVSVPLAAVDIIDLKEPGNGPLGAVAVTVVHEVREYLGTDRQLSVALGELISVDPTNWQRDLAAVDYAKLGMSGMRSNNDWKRLLRSAFDRLPSATAPVAVAYADDDWADSPTPESILEFAIDQGAKVFLLDTFTKNGRSLFHYLTPARLMSLRERCAQAGVEFALAGSIDSACLSDAIGVRPDIIGVRGAVTTGERDAAVDPEKVSQFREEIEARHLASAFSPTVRILQEEILDRK
jgi:(5-formylfuran-3-yl)methyl phosphate synthase